jgi:hypothetical protein
MNYNLNSISKIIFAKNKRDVNRYSTYNETVDIDYFFDDKIDLKFNVATYNKVETNNIFTHTLTITLNEEMNILLREMDYTDTYYILFFNDDENSFFLKGNLLSNNQILDDSNNNITITFVENTNLKSIKLNVDFSKYLNSII